MLLIATLATILSLGVSTRLVIKTNFKDLLGPDDPVSIQQTYVEDNFPVVSSVRVLVEGLDEARLIEVGHDIAERLESEPDKVRMVTLEQPVDFFVEHSLLYLDVADLRLAESTLTERGDAVGALLADPSTVGLMAMLDAVVREQARPADAVATVNSRLFSQLALGDGPAEGLSADFGVALDTSPVAQQLTDQMIRTMKPLPLPGSRDEALRTLRGANELFDMVADVLEQGERVTPGAFEARSRSLREPDFKQMGLPFERYTLSPDRTALLVDVVPMDRVLNIDVARPFLAWMEAELDDVRSRNPDVTVQMTGLPVLLKEESESILDNFVVVTLLGFVGVLAVFIIGFERVGLPSLATVPLLMGSAWTFGVVVAVNGEMTLFALTFPVLLFGIGIDFAIHLLAGYSDERRAALEPEAALRAAFDKVGPGLLTGALTTACAFLVMMISAFFGLRDMGFTAGIGVLMALLAMLTVLPALVVGWDRRQSARGAVLPDVPFPFLAPLGRRLQRHRYLVLAAFMAATITLGFFISNVELDRNYLNTLPEGMPSASAQARILEKFGANNEFITFFAEDLEEVERIRVAAEAASTMGAVIAPSVLIPSDQEHKRGSIEALAALLDAMAPEGAPPTHTYDAAEIDGLRDHLASIKVSALQLSMLASVLYDDEVRAAAGALRDTINRVDARVDPASASRLAYLDTLLAAEIGRAYAGFRRMTANTSLTPEGLPASILGQLRGEDGTWLVLARGSGDVWAEEFRTALLEDAGRIDPEYAGMVVAWHRGLSLLLGELPRVFGWTTFAVALLVFLDLRSLRATVLAMTPLALGLVWTLGVMGMLGIPFNIISIVAIPLLVGIGIDNGVHIYHRIRKEGRLDAALKHSGKPVLLTSMTTGIGFGSLMLSVHPGLHALGFATTVGIVSCLLVSLLLLPALVAIFDEGALREGDPGDAIDEGGEE